MKMEPDGFIPEINTVWDFHERGNWCTHNGSYRGNSSPYVPRNLILKYSNIGDLVLDQFCGSGTTLVEAKLLSRNSIGIDVNTKALEITEKNLNFSVKHKTNTVLLKGDATNMSNILSDSIDMICTHPPYANIIKYSKSISGDLSLLDLDDFLLSMKDVSIESYRVLKKNKYLTFLIGDIRHNKRVFPLGFKVLETFVEAGFTLKEIIIKKQNNCRSTPYWTERIKFTDFYLLAHEYIFVLVK